MYVHAHVLTLCYVNKLEKDPLRIRDYMDPTLRKVVSAARKHTELLCFLLRSVQPADQSLHCQKFIVPSTPPVYSPHTHHSLTP